MSQQKTEETLSDVSDLELGPASASGDVSTADIPPTSSPRPRDASHASSSYRSTDLSPLRGTDDILAYVEQLKGQRVAGNGRTQTSMVQDLHGNDFLSRYTALSSVSEKSDQRTNGSLTDGSTHSDSARSLPARYTLAQSLRIPDWQEKGEDGQSTKSSSSTSPSKRAVSPALARRIGKINPHQPSMSSQTGTRPLLSPSKSTNDLIRFFDGDSLSNSSKSTSLHKQSRPASPSDGRGKMIFGSSPLADLNIAPTRPLVISRAVPASSKICSGELVYAPGPTTDWVPCTATLFSDHLVIEYSSGRSQHSFRIGTRDLKRVESIRGAYLLPTDGQPVVHGFDLICRNAAMPAVRLGSHKPAERVQWISRLLDMLEYASSISDDRSNLSMPSRSIESMPGDDLPEPGAVPGWSKPASLRTRSASEVSRPSSTTAANQIHLRSSRLKLSDVDHCSAENISPFAGRSSARPHSPPLPALPSHGSPSGTTAASPRAIPKIRGAWSDADRKSTQSDGLLLGGYRPGRAVARDMTKLLRLMERQDSMALAKSQDFCPRLDDMREQLSSIAARLRSQPYADEVDDVCASNEPTIADKVDYMLSLCSILMESHNKMSSQIEQALASKGVLPDESPTTRRRPSDAASLKAAALNRIEELLQTVLGRLEGSPEGSPENKMGHTAIKADVLLAADLTPRALVPKRFAVVTDNSNEATSARSFKGMPDERSAPQQTQQSEHDLKIARHLAITQDRPEEILDRPTAITNGTSRWSATTPEAFGPSRHISTAIDTMSADSHLSRPKSPTETTYSAGSRSVGFDERTQLIMQGIMNKLQQLSDGNENTDKHQTEVINYLSRVDNFLRQDIAARNSEWQTILSTLNSVKSTIDALPVQLQGLSGNTQNARADERNVQPPSELPPAQVADDSCRRGSLLRRIRGSEPPQSEAGEMGQSPRKRSLSTPKGTGPRNLGIRLWGGPTPAGRAAVPPWQRKPKPDKNGSDVVAEDLHFQSLGHTSDRPGSIEPELDAMLPRDPLLQHLGPSSRTALHERPPQAPLGPRMPFVPPVHSSAAPQAPPTLLSHGTAQPLLASSEGLISIQASIGEVLSYLREQAMREQQRSQRDEEASRRFPEPSATEKQRELDRKADSIRDQAKESKLDALIASLEKRSAEHDNLLRKIAEVNAPKPEIDRDGKLPSLGDGQKVLDSIRDGFDVQVRDFKQSLASEVRTMLAEVGALRDQKKTLQAELAELFAFKAKHGQGAPDLPAYAPPKSDGHISIGGGIFKPSAPNPSGARRTFGPFGVPPRGPR